MEKNAFSVSLAVVTLGFVAYAADTNTYYTVTVDGGTYSYIGPDAVTNRSAYLYNDTELSIDHAVLTFEDGSSPTVFEGDGKIRDFPGNYTQYLQKRNSEQREQTLQKKSEKPQYERKRTTVKPTYKQQQEYKTLTEELQRLEAEKKELEANLASPEGATAEQLAQWSERIGQVLAEIDEKELRWLELDEIVG